MKLTKFYKFKKPEGADIVDVNDLSDNFEAIDEKLHEIEEGAGDVSESWVFASTASTRNVIESGDTLAVIVGKIMRWFADLKASAFRDVANNLTTTANGYVLDARQGKTLQDSIDSISTSFLVGCRTIARAITAGRGTYSSPVDGVSTADNASPDAMATNVKTLATKNYNSGKVDTLKGNATSADVLQGKTFTSEAAGVGKTGSIVDYRGSTRTVTPSGGTGNETLTLSEGVHDQVIVNRSQPYNAGYSAGQSAGRAEVELHKVLVGTMSSTQTGADTYDFTFSVPGVELTVDNFFLIITEFGGSGSGGWVWSHTQPTVTYNASTGAVHVSGMSHYGGDGTNNALARVNSASLYCVYTKPRKSFITTK